MTMSENMNKISNGIYLVRTQAGFEKAIRDFSSEKLDIVGFPKSYPSVVCLSFGYRGDIYIAVKCVHVKKMRAALEGA